MRDMEEARKKNQEGKYEAREERAKITEERRLLEEKE
jgi:hypothetical protein